MSVKIEDFAECYKTGVLNCFKRNYKWMSRISDVELECWVNPLFSYTWKESDLNIGHKYGQVILDDDKVVGYLGYIISNRVDDGKEYKYLNASTWAIDDGYRIYLFKALKLAFKDVDVISDFSAISAVYNTLVKVFKFKQYNDRLYRCFPIPFIAKSNVKIKTISNAVEICDGVYKREYEDHQHCGVKCLEITELKSSKKFYVFYVNAHSKRKFIFRPFWVKVLKITESSIFSRYAHEIIWHLQKSEKTYVEIDENLLDMSFFCHPWYKVKKVHSLVLDKSGIDVKPDLLYSELVLLKS